MKNQEDKNRVVELFDRILKSVDLKEHLECLLALKL